jgi:hypothetical protein
MILTFYKLQIPDRASAFLGFVKTAWLSCLVLSLVGCNSLNRPLGDPPASDPDLDQHPAPQGQQTFADHQDPYQGLLDLADHALKRRHLTEPKATSALTYFNLILIEDRNHQAAKAGLVAIIDQYLEWALRAIEAANYAEANSFLERAARVNPKSSEIAAMADRLRRKREEGSFIEILPSWVISARNAPSQSPKEQAQVSAYFHEVAQKIESLKAKVSIYSRGDAEGRWLYQQLNANTPERLRGTLKSDNPSRIEMHFKDNPSTIDP